MKNAIKTAALLLLCILLTIGTANARAEEEKQQPELIYFFENYCDACHPEVDFIETFHNLTGHRADEYAYFYYNIRNQKNRELFNETAEAYGIAESERFLPMAIVDGKVYAGSSKLESALPMDFMENESTDSVIYYLYSPACESCAEADKVLDELPENVTVKRGKVETESRLIIRRINIFEDPSTAQALFQRYRVPEDRQTTPIVFLREDYINGAEQIESRLPYTLNAGLAVGTALIAPAADTEISVLSVTGSIAAGFVAGFNPCALSMLLLFLSILLSAGKHIVRYAAVYLLTKWVTYLAIGVFFLSIFSALNPIWLPAAAKVLLTVVGGVLIILNLLDARSAKEKKYGEIRNQLPQRLRRFLNGFIRSRMNGKAAAGSAVLLGVVVAASEFLCSGQLYLATLIAGLNAGTAYGRQLLLLAVFCVAFLLPSVCLTLVVTRSRNMFAASNAILSHMPLIKLVTALAMLGIILAAWFLV